MRIGAHAHSWAFLAAVVFALVAAPVVHAGGPIEQDKTIFTFSGPVMVPGATLPPGTYVFKTLQSTGSQPLAQITSEDGMNVFVTTFTVPVRRTESKSGVVVKFAETDPGVAPAIMAWFYPGSRTGHEFIYPDNQAQVIADATKTLVLSADQDDLTARELRESSINVTADSGSKMASQAGDWDNLPRVVSADPSTSDSGAQ